MERQLRTVPKRLFPEAWAHLTEISRKYIHRLQARVVELEERVKDLEALLEKNSQNSHLPPSRDFYRPKPQSLRKKSSKRAGAQVGHEGYSLKPAEKPDHIIEYKIYDCSCCGRSLDDVLASGFDWRQVFDLPERLKLEVSEHRVEIKHCPDCKLSSTALFPKGINAPLQYGVRFKALASYLMHAQFLPYNRVRQMLSDLFGVPIAHGTLSKLNRAFYKNLDFAEEMIKSQLIESEVAHFDETGLKNNLNQHWLHVCSTQDLTYLSVHRKRGKKAMKDIGVLPYFKGRAIHDGLKGYFTFNGVTHGLCNAHILRELTFLEEQLKEPWAKKMKDLLMEINKHAERVRSRGKNRFLQRPVIENFEGQYDILVEEGLKFHKHKIKIKSIKKQGRQKQRPGKNLLDRLQEHKGDILAFMHDIDVPFTNNQAERDLRMAKLKNKISGTFRSEHGPKEFARIRGYLQTARKQNWPILQAMTLALQGLAPVPGPSPLET